MTKRITLKKEFSQESTWRDALGESEPLLIFSDWTDCLDAPDWIPAGATKQVQAFYGRSAHPCFIARI